MSNLVRSVLIRVLLAGLVAVLASASLGAAPRDADGGWSVVAFDHRILEADRALLEDLGAGHIRYRPADTYVAYLSSHARSTLRGRDGIRSVGLLPPGDKLHTAVAPGQPASVRMHVDGLASPAVAAVLDGGARTIPAASDGTVVDLLAPQLPAPETLAALPAVLSIGPAGPARLEDEMSDQILAGNLRSGTDVEPGYRQFLAGLGLNGAGVRVSVVDSGVDASHPDLQDAVVEKLEYGPTPLLGEPVDSYGHGTHVAGIIAGRSATFAEQNFVDGTGFELGLGVAPAAEIVDQNAIASTNLLTFPPADGYEELTRTSLAVGSSIWNASWTSGEGEGVGYIATAATMDQLVRDGDWGTPGNQAFAMVFSAGNSGDGGGQNDVRITAPKEAKNIIAVASSDNARRTPGLAGGSGDPRRISPFSSRGPARDGRVVPTLTAPGADIIAAKSSAGAAACNQAAAQSASPFHAYCSGTSMASPHVAGAVALLTQWWQDQFGDNPSPAMAKALLINTATDMLKPDIPNRHEGWGRVNLGNLFASGPRMVSDQESLLTDPGDAQTWKIHVADTSKPLRISLVWTDAPGQPDAEVALVNDLDLIVRAPGNATYHGNNFEDGMTVPGGSPDRVNNVENVYIDAPRPGVYTVEVRAHNLPDDGVPGFGDGTDQDFALVIDNAR